MPDLYRIRPPADHHHRGRPLKCRENRPGSIVADVIITFKSGRCGKSCFRYPNKKSIFSDRSCASSIMIVSYCKSSRSDLVLHAYNQRLSVITSMKVLSETLSEKADFERHLFYDCVFSLLPQSALPPPAPAIRRGCRVTDHPVNSPSHLQADLGQLRRLPRARLPTNHYHHTAVVLNHRAQPSPFSPRPATLPETRFADVLSCRHRVAAAPELPQFACRNSGSPTNCRAPMLQPPPHRLPSPQKPGLVAQHGAGDKMGDVVGHAGEYNPCEPSRGATNTRLSHSSECFIYLSPEFVFGI